MAAGIATDPDLKYETRAENIALVFSGRIEIPSTGAYTFHLLSDDGGELQVGDPRAACEVSALKRKSTPALRQFEAPLAEPFTSQWTEVEGQVIFAGHDENGLALELIAREERVRATVIKSGDS